MNKPAVLFILSAKHCDPELQAEFGAQLPACMVPIGPNRLLDLQMKEARSCIQNLQCTFVALPTSRFSPGEENWPDDMKACPMETKSMDDTFEQLMWQFEEWYRSSERKRSVFEEDEWIIHFINGDTLITDTRSWRTVGTCYVSLDDAPFQMSKEFSKDREMLPRPGEHLEYAGKGSFIFSVKAEQKNSPSYGSYMDIVRNGAPRQVLLDWWYDFGHAETYFRSKRNLLSSRAFNSVKLDSYTGIIYKSSGFKQNKLVSEYEWYTAVPEVVAMYLPRVMKYQPECGAFMYGMEYLPCPTLAELLVYGNQSTHFWHRIAKKLVTLLETLKGAAPADFVAHDGLFLQKVRDRCEKLTHPWKANVNELITWLEPRIKEAPAVLHGDLCFSNILYDRRSDSLKTIDPRGYSAVNGIYGNQLYDVAKLFHSTYAGYDFALANLAADPKATSNCAVLSDEIKKYAVETLGVSEAELYCVTALLFYSMLPLHTDDMKRVDRLLLKGEVCLSRWTELVGGVYG